MNHAELITRLTEWHITLADVEQQQDLLMKLTGGVEGTLFLAINDLAIAYTKAVSQIVGDTNEWLDWWWQECDLGSKPMSASAGNDDPMHPIQTLAELAALIQ